MATAQDVFFWVYPPTVSTEDALHQVLVDTTGAAADNYDWVTALGSDAPKGTVWLRLEASTEDVFVRFKSTTSAAGTTASNGLLIKADQPGQPFYVNPTRHGVIDHIAPGGAGTLRIQVASPIGQRNRV